MDAMDLRSKMGSTLYLAAGAILGACVMLYVSRRRRRKTTNDDNSQKDALLCLQGELEEYRKSLEEVYQRLERETERRNESEAWSRKLESDLMDHVSARKHVEEKCFKLMGDLEDTQRKLKDAVKKGEQLEIELIDLRATRYNAPSDRSIFSQNPDVKGQPETEAAIAKVTRESLKHKKDDDVSVKHDVANDVINTLGEVIRGNDDVIDDGIIETLQVKLLDQQTDKHLKEQYEQDEEYEVYPEEDDDDDDDFSDEDEDEEEDYDEEEQLVRHKKTVLDTSEDHFELGKDVMGALIANAFKDGVIASREGDDSTPGVTSGSDQQNVTSHGNDIHNGHTQKDKGEVSQESFDVKTTRRFWEQMIASDRHDNACDDDDSDDITDDDDDDEDDVIDDEDDLTDEEEEETEGNDYLGNISKQQNLISQKNASSPEFPSTKRTVHPNNNVPRGEEKGALCNGDGEGTSNSS